MNHIRRNLLASFAVLAAVGFGAPASAQSKAAKPLNIVVYGGSGNVGTRVVNEAVARGHHVTVVDRAPKAELAPKGVKLVVGDALDKNDILKNAAGADVLVSAVVAPIPDFPLNAVKSYVAALREQTGGKKTRLFVVGGSSSLYTPEGKLLIDTRQLPPAVDARLRSGVAALAYLRTVNDVTWTYFSPPGGSFEPGTRTGKFRLGTEQPVVDAQGKNVISMEDYAVAALDEFEKPQYLNKRFTIGY